MRYILDDEGYIKDLSFDSAFTCNGKRCLLYEGDIPDGYESLDDWATNSNIRAFFISNGNLTYSEERDQYLIDLWDREIGLNDNQINYVYGYCRTQGGMITLTPEEKNTTTSIDVVFECPFSKLPIISLTASEEVESLYYTNKSTTGFTINVTKKDSTSINVDWLAKARI